MTNSIYKKQLEPGDHILSVNGEDVKDAPRDHVIQLVRNCESRVELVVSQPRLNFYTNGRKSTLLSPAKKHKLKSRPIRVRFAESVCVNGSPLFPVIICSMTFFIDKRSYICSLKARLYAFFHKLYY